MSTDEFKSCLDRLDGLVVDVKELRTMIGDRSVLTGPVRVDAQERLRDLKATLVSEKRRMRKPGTVLSDAEERYYVPAIEQADAYLTIRPNSVPGREWFSELYDLQITLEDEDLRQFRVKAVGKGEIDDAVSTAKGHGRLGAVPREGFQSLAASSG